MATILGSLACPLTRGLFKIIIIIAIIINIMFNDRQPYEFDIRIPMLMRGPGVQANVTSKVIRGSDWDNSDDGDNVGDDNGDNSD